MAKINLNFDVVPQRRGTVSVAKNLRKHPKGRSGGSLLLRSGNQWNFAMKIMMMIMMTAMMTRMMPTMIMMV